MLKSILEFFESNLAGGRESAPSRHTIELATAALLVEVVRCDEGITDDERNAVQKAVHEKFGLSHEEAGTLIRLAEDEVRQANDYFQFTSLINRHFTQQQKLRVIELMWQVALADAEISAHEHHVLRRIAELLHIPHGDYILAKTRVQQAAVG